MRPATTQKRRPPAATERQVRAVVVCRPVLPHDLERLRAPAASMLEELPILQPSPPPSPTSDPDAAAGLLRDIALGRLGGATAAGGGAQSSGGGGGEGGGEAVVRLPLFGHRGADIEQLCEREVAPLLERLLAGESAAVVAYGQTGSGKSYTMGTERFEEGRGPQEHSVASYCARRIFEQLAEQEGVKGLEVSFAAIEIYREGSQTEALFDLLTLERKKIQSFRQQATWQRALDARDLQRKLLAASFLRNTDRTDGNSRSSRSHAIFITQARLGQAAPLRFQRQQPSGGGSQRVKAQLMLVDLAGSERASLAAAGSTQQRQGSGINVGLLWLGTVIRELAAKGSTQHYRSSTLTELLRPALGGGSNEVTSGCNTLIVGCIAPLALYAVNTKATLEFLQQAGTVRNVVRPDVQMLRQLELEAQVEQLQRQVRELQLQQAAAAAAGEGSPSGPPPVAAAAAAAAAGEAPSEAGSEGPAAASELAAAEERIAALQLELEGARRDLAVQRDRADAFEDLLRQQAEAAAAAPAAAAAAAAGGQAVAPGAATPGGEAAAAGAAGLAATPVGAAAARASGGLHASGGPAFLAASPLLAASPIVAEWAAAAQRAEAATPVGAPLPLLQLLPGAAELCCAAESHMHPDELQALLDKLERTLASAADGDERTQAKAFAEAALYATAALNKALGDAVTRAEVAEEAKEEEAALFARLFAEKSDYMKQLAAAEQGLNLYETQVEELKAEVKATQAALRQAQQQLAQAASPSRWASLGRLITGGGGGGGESRRSSHSGSPTGSPRASPGAGHQAVPQQLFGSPSRLGALHGQGGGASGADGGRRATIACVRGLAGEQEAALQAALAAKQRKSAAALLERPAAAADGSPGSPGSPSSLIKAGRPSPAVAASPPPQEQQLPEQQPAAEDVRQPERMAASPLQQPAEEQQAAEPMAASPLPQASEQQLEPMAASPLHESPERQRPGDQQQGGEPMAASPLPQQPEEQQHDEGLQPMAASPLHLGPGQQPEGQPRPSPGLQAEEQQEAEAEAGSRLGTPIGSPEPSCIPGDGSSEQESAPAPPDGGGPEQGSAELAEQDSSPLQQAQQQPASAAAAAAAVPQQHTPQPPPQEREQQAQQEQQQAEQAPPLLPGPRIAVYVPVGASGRGRRRQAASWQVLEWEPASGHFFDPESEERVDALSSMALPAGEPWQRRVLLKGSSAITLDRWLARRMLLPGRCHNCASEAPAPRRRHPEPAFDGLRLCEDCYQALEPAVWKRAEGGWLPEEPGEVTFQWCCLCGGSFAGGTTDMVVCSRCSVNGFCTGCLWRYTNDDLAAVREDPAWQCLLCRPDPLRLAYVESTAAERDASAASGGSGRSGRSGRSASRAQQQAAEGGEGAATALRRGARARRPPGQQQQQQQQQQQAQATPGDFRDFTIDLTASSSEGEGEEEAEEDDEPEEASSPSSSSSDEEFDAEAERRRRPASRRAGGAGKKAAASTAVAAAGARRERKPAAAAAAVKEEESAAAAEAAGPSQAQQPPAARKRRLLAVGDILDSPGVDGERPAHAHQRQRYHGAQRTAASQPAASQARQPLGSQRQAASQRRPAASQRDLMSL